MKIRQTIAVTAVASMALLAGSTAATAAPVNGDQTLTAHRRRQHCRLFVGSVHLAALG